MAIVQMPIKSPIPDGKYVIKNRAADLYWNAYTDPIGTLYFCPSKMEIVKIDNWAQVKKHFPIIQVFKG